MWAAFSIKEQNERIFQLKMEEENLRKEGKLEERSNRLAGARSEYKKNVLWLMGDSAADVISRQKAIQEKMKESGEMIIFYNFDALTLLHLP